MKHLITIMLLACTCCGCKKFLDKKPDIKLQLLTTIDAVQGLLDADAIMSTNNPGAGEASADNYFVHDATFNGLSSEAVKNTYIWGDDITLSEFGNNWSRLYDVVTTANVCLESLEKITATPATQDAWNNAEGSALVFRAKSWLTVIGYFTKGYNKNTAAGDMGIPLRMNSDYNPTSFRASLQDSYDAVINDLKAAAPLLPVVPRHVMRPSQTAAYGLLARTYLLMNNYDSALVYADKYLALKNVLLNLNSLSTTDAYAFPLYNTEVSMHSLMFTPTILAVTRALVDSNLYRSYDANDLRKSLYFKSLGNGTYSFRGSYNQTGLLFTGVTTDEVYLAKAECLVRTGKGAEGMDVLNALMKTRWKTGTFPGFGVGTTTAMLRIILNERRKELIFRDLRWMDLKRINLEPDFQVILYRKLNGKDYVLPPNDNRYALPIPSSVIAMSGMPQNPR